MTVIRNALGWVLTAPSRPAIALRTAVQTFLGVLVAAWVKDGDGLASTIPDVVAGSVDFAAGSALLAALGAAGWHTGTRAWAARRDP